MKVKAFELGYIEGMGRVRPGTVFELADEKVKTCKWVRPFKGKPIVEDAEEDESAEEEVHEPAHKKGKGKKGHPTGDPAPDVI
jgi:hypothetical protein